MLCLEDVDELFSAIVSATSVNADYLYFLMGPEAADWYLRRNKHSLIASQPSETEEGTPLG